MLGGSIDSNNGKIVTSRIFTIETDPFLRHHVFGPSSLNTADDVQGVAIVPFTFSMETIAEAARHLTGWRSSCFSLRNLKANRWLALDEKELITEIVAEPLSSAKDEIHVRVLETGGSNRQVAFEGIASSGVRNIAGRTFGMSGISRPKITAEEFNSRIFHGPLLSTFRRTINVGATGAEIEAVIPSNKGMFRDCDDPQMVIPAALLDATGQLVGYWLMEQKLPSFVLPFRLNFYEQFLPPPQPGTSVFLHSQIFFCNDIATANIDITMEDNTMLARLEGLKMKLYSLPERYMDYIFHHNYKSRVSVLCASSPQSNYGRQIDLEEHNYLGDGQSIWTRLLARLVFSDQEKVTWRQLSAKLHVSSLLSKIVAKEIMLDWLEVRGITIGPRDIETSISKGRVCFSCRLPSTNVLKLPDGIVEQHNSTIKVGLLAR